MKKIIILGMALIMVVCLAGCVTKMKKAEYKEINFGIPENWIKELDEDGDDMYFSKEDKEDNEEGLYEEYLNVYSQALTDEEFQDLSDSVVLGIFAGFTKEEVENAISDIKEEDITIEGNKGKKISCTLPREEGDYEELEEKYYSSLFFIKDETCYFFDYVSAKDGNSEKLFMSIIESIKFK